MTRFADITQGLLHMEMDLHRSYAGELGISSAQLEREEMLPTTQGYTDFLVRTAAVGDFVELTAELLPCIWGYAEIAQRLAGAERPADERYARWIAMYASSEFASGSVRRIRSRWAPHLAVSAPSGYSRQSRSADSRLPPRARSRFETDRRCRTHRRSRRSAAAPLPRSATLLVPPRPARGFGPAGLASAVVSALRRCADAVREMPADRRKQERLDRAHGLLELLTSGHLSRAAGLPGASGTS